MAQIGAALGRQFSHELIGAVAQIPQTQLDDALAQLVRAELMFRRGTPPDAEYTFKHALVQDAAYDTLLRGRRQQIHTRIAATPEGQFPEIVETKPEVLARHCGEAGLVEKAVNYWLKAGQQALLRSAMLEAEARLRKGLDLVASLPVSTERQQYELDLQLARGTALVATQSSAVLLGESHLRARQLCDQLGRPSQLAVLLAGQCAYHLGRAELVLACQESKELLDLGETGNDAAAKLAGCAASAGSWFHRGDFTAACAYASRALALYDPAHPPIWASPTLYDAQIWALTYSFRPLFYLGYLDQARLRRDEGWQSHTNLLMPIRWLVCLALL